MTTGSSLAPIALFVYRRPAHTRRLLDSLARNPEAARSQIWVFCEGARDASVAGEVEATRRLVRTHPLAPSFRIVERETNLGCAASIVRGIGEVLAVSDRLIVLEDDLELAPGFLAYMNEALARYADVPRVMQVCGYAFPGIAPSRSADDAMFLPVVNSWGWATWRRAWALYDDGSSNVDWLDRFVWRQYRFDLHGAYRYRRMLHLRQSGAIDAWDICWYLSVFRADGLCVYPRRSLIANHGFDGSGTHEPDVRLRTELDFPQPVRRWPAMAKADRGGMAALRGFLRAGRVSRLALIRELASRFRHPAGHLT